MQPYKFPFSKEDGGLISTSGVIYPSDSVAQVFQENDRCFERLLGYFNRIRERGLLGDNLRREFRKFYEELWKRALPDKYRLGFYAQHLDFITSGISAAHVREKVESLVEKLGQEDHLEDWQTIKRFLDNQEDYLISHFRIQSPEGSTISGYEERAAVKKVPFILQYGVYFYGLPEDFPVRSRKEIIPASKFYEESRKRKLDVLAEPHKTLTEKPIAVDPIKPSLGLDKFVEKIECER